MHQQSFTLDGRFYIQPSLNSVTDKKSGKETRLEPRLMNLLCLLASHPGGLVSREQITKEIWDDYGNADEGLTQGISYLRKILEDETKELIETIPKKGYVLHATVTAAKKRGMARPYWWITILLIGFIITYFVMKDKTQDKPKNPDRMQEKQDVKKPDALPDTTKVVNPDKLPDTLKSSSGSADKIK